MNYEFNGMLDSVLPNLYINRITLEQKNTRPLSNNKYDMTPHINQTIADRSEDLQGEVAAVDIFGNVTEYTTTYSSHPSLTPDYGGFEDKLRVTFDLFLEIPNIDSDGFWQEIFSDEFSTYLSANIILFNGSKGKEYYKKILGQKSTAWAGATVSVQDVAMYLALSTGGKWTGLGLVPDWKLIKGTDYEYTENSSLFDQLLGPGQFLAPADGGDTNDAQKLAFIKQKYAKTLPDGTIVHKVPIQITMEINGAFPTDLAAIAYCGFNSDTLTLFEGTEKTGKTQVDFSETPGIGRAATEVIIQNKKVIQKGMIFFVSAKQDSKAFKHLEGQLWFGGVHKAIDADGNYRYAAGNERLTGPYGKALKQPYLDYIVVPNHRVQDFRQMGMIQKQIASFNPFTEFMLGGSYTDLRSSTIPVSFDKYGLFSDLLSTVTKDKRVKLFFSADWGKAIKKHCTVPAVLDMLAAADSPVSLKGVMNSVGTPVSFKVFRERLEGPPSIGVVDPKNNASILINRLDKELIYSNYPQLYYWKDASSPNEPASSALMPISLASLDETGFLKHYSFTDYDIETISSGIFKYSVEIEVTDPTITFLVNALTIMQGAVDTLKKYTYLANGVGTTLQGKANEYYWNSYLGKFEDIFVEAAVDEVGFVRQEGDPLLPPSITDAIPYFEFFFLMSRTAWTPLNVAIGAEDLQEEISSAGLLGMLNPSTASPDSITAAYQVFDTLTTQLVNFLNSFSTAKVPKVDTGQFFELDDSGNKVYYSSSPLLQTKSPVSSEALRRNITITHTFGGPSELVDTTKFDAGYDILADQLNYTSSGVGFKIISYNQFANKVNAQHEKYFKGTTETSLKIKPPGAIQEFNITTQPWWTFTVGQNFKGEKGWPYHNKWVQFTRLPKSIKDRNEENEYWKLINNIIRYKLNLAGNPGEQSWLGYGAPSEGYQTKNNIPGSEFIGNKMERILKEYQSLSSLGAYFIHQHKAKWGDPALGAGITGEITGFPYTNSSIAQETLKNDGTTVPWAKDSQQERFLLALIIQDYCNLTYWDKKLGSFNAGVHGPLGKYLRESWLPSMGAQKHTAWAAVAQDLPDQVKVLMAAFDSSNYELIQDSKNYGAGANNSLYIKKDTKDVDEGALKSNKTLLLNKFGDFWFNHQNLFQIEYLAGYKEVSQIDLPWVTSPGNFENVYSQTVKTPIWIRLDNLPDASLPSGPSYLCRLKKLRLPFFNQSLYDLLDLPLYDEYFFLTTNQQSGVHWPAANLAALAYPSTVTVKEPVWG